MRMMGTGSLRELLFPTFVVKLMVTVQAMTLVTVSAVLFLNK